MAVLTIESRDEDVQDAPKQPQSRSYITIVDRSRKATPRRKLYLDRRIAIFEAWSESVSTYQQIGNQFATTKVRTAQIIWKAVVDDGCRSGRARSLMKQADDDGYWLERYDANFERPSPKAVEKKCKKVSVRDQDRQSSLAVRKSLNGGGR